MTNIGKNAHQKVKRIFAFWNLANKSFIAKDLVAKFLHKDPSKRISLVDAAQHPWIKVIFFW